MGTVYELPYSSNYESQSVNSASGLLVWRIDFSGVGPLDYKILSRDSGIKCAGFMTNTSYILLMASNSPIYFSIGRYHPDGSAYNINTQSSSIDYLDIGVPYSYQAAGDNKITSYIDLYDSREEAVAAITGEKPITYRLTNCTAPGAPDSARPGDFVSITLTPNTGYDFINPASDIYVTNNGVAVQASYANGRLTFTMP